MEVTVTKRENGETEPGSKQPSMVAGRTGNRWSRRRLLLGALGLVSAAAVGSQLALDGFDEEKASADEDPWANLSQQRIWLCFAGHRGAYSFLDRLLQPPIHRTNAPARLMRACLYLEHGSLDAMRHDLRWPEVKHTPEAALLLALAERRSRSPDWRHAFFESWDALGRPDFSKSPLLPEPVEDTHLLPLVHDEKLPFKGPQGLPLLTVIPEQEGFLEWGPGQVRASDSVPLLMALRERLALLGAEEPARQQLLPAAEARLTQLTSSTPSTLQLALRTFLAERPPEALLQRRDLEALEPLVSLEWKQPSSEPFFQEMRESLKDVLLLPGHHAFLLATWAQGVSLGQELQRRARASAAHILEDERRWMGRLLWEVGARLREQRSRLELERGLLLQVYGSELTGHSPTRMESIDLWVELGRWEEALKRSGFKRWPLASLHEESRAPRLYDEHTWLKAFAGKNPLP
ncbi:hypothetical protein [Archangium lansingense]|uniref:Uncharacterized protein n=1 Tax=Archangium lansingense TaxID=2995310 RepID=A0ABT4ALN3_9BACT|nr:hypothetical protein [Archangium lansinium]MCY1082606.1 hypothetical protein [Archangium lansinium]